GDGSGRPLRIDGIPLPLSRAPQPEAWRDDPRSAGAKFGPPLRQEGRSPVELIDGAEAMHQHRRIAMHADKTTFSRRTVAKLAATAIALTTFGSLTMAASSAETLVINTDRSGAGQKEAMNKIAKDFEAANPGVSVTINYSDVE